MLKSALLAAVIAGSAAPALAQIAPDQIPVGVVRGIQPLNSSAQVGELVLHAGAVIVDLKGTHGKPEAVTINRGFDCSTAPGKLVAVLGTLTNGHLAAPAPLPADRLMSGNYLVVVHNNEPNSAPVACGHLYH
jgi:hypothetical protein